MRRIRIGIDVGGTFTHAVAIDTQKFNIVTQTKTHTTYSAKEGVALGIVIALMKLLRKGEIDPREIVVVAHSTTQATNALLEGDVAKVGIIGMGTGLKSFRVRRETQINQIELAPGKMLGTCYRYLDTALDFSEEMIRQAINELRDEGAEAIVAAEAFSIENPEHEFKVVALANQIGLPATASRNISQLYGLRIRTRTAVINASMLPVMIRTAKMTEGALRSAGIKAPLMIMRSDGGVMDIRGMRERPIMTMLSGPAAGIAAALMYSRASDGIFVEVGGTSTDISVIQHGSVAQRTARVGRHKLQVKTLDVRTVGVAGGSMPRVNSGEIIDVGPRSAHISGLPYEAFSYINEINRTEATLGAPAPLDPDDYIYLQGADSKHAITVTGAANLLGLISSHDFARGGDQTVNIAFEKLSRFLDKDANELAKEILDCASAKIISVINELCQAYNLKFSSLSLIGGGGGAATLVPYIANRLQIPFELVEHSAILPAIGVALAMVRETIELNLIEPTEKDLLKIRQDVETLVLDMGAAPETVEVKVDIDTQRNIVRAVAIGSTEPQLFEKIGRSIPADQRSTIAAGALNVDDKSIRILASTDFFTAYTGEMIVPRFFGLIKQRLRPVAVIDQYGVIRLNFSRAQISQGSIDRGEKMLKEFVQDQTYYGDGGAKTPSIHLAIGPRLVDFTGLTDARQIIYMGKHEFKKFTPDTPILFIAENKN